MDFTQVSFSSRERFSAVLSLSWMFVAYCLSGSTINWGHMDDFDVCIYHWTGKFTTQWAPEISKIHINKPRGSLRNVLCIGAFTPNHSQHHKNSWTECRLWQTPHKVQTWRGFSPHGIKTSWSSRKNQRDQRRDQSAGQHVASPAGLGFNGSLSQQARIRLQTPCKNPNTFISMCRDYSWLCNVKMM